MEQKLQPHQLLQTVKANCKALVVLIISFSLLGFVPQNISDYSEPLFVNSETIIDYLELEDDDVTGLNYSHTANSSWRFPASQLSKEQILNDSLKRIDRQFQVTDSFYRRVSFWFDVYTKYSNMNYVLHHKDYPWIVFAVIDVTPIFKANEHSKNKWKKYHLAEAFVRTERQRIFNELRRFSKLKNFDHLDGKNFYYLQLLQEIPGKNRQKVARAALENMRTQIGQREFIESGISAGSKYLPHMEEIFKSYGLPLELTRIPFVESSFNTAAESRVGASGVWQFMPSTGKVYMKVDEHIDERNSPLKATEAAAKLLSQYKKALKTWPLSVTAYNHGIGSLYGAVKTIKTDDLSVIIQKYKAPSFGFASMNFYSSFLAALYTEKYHDEIFGNISKQTPMDFRIVKLKKQITLKKLLRVVKIKFSKFQDYNKDISDESLDENITLPRGYRLHLPEEYVTRLQVFEKSRIKGKDNRLTINDKNKTAS